MFFKQNKYAEAQQYNFKALKIREEIGIPKLMLETWLNISSVYRAQGENKLAFEYCDKIRSMMDGNISKSQKVHLYDNLGNLYFNMNNYNQALKYFTLSLQLSKETQNIESIKIAEKAIAETYEKLYSPLKALEHYKEFIIANDSVYNQSKSKTIVEMQTKYEVKEQENKIAMLNKDNELLQTTNESERKSKILIIIVCIALLTLLLLLYRQNRVKQKLAIQNQQTEMLQLEQKLLRLQMNPHFIFNALGAIQSFIQKNEKEEATSYLSKFSRLVRTILENSRMDYVSMGKEIKSLKDYLELQQLLFDNKFGYDILVDENIDTENICIPPMLAQPFIENALKHGLANSEKKGVLNISFKLKDNLILFDVIDNGIGLHKALELKSIAGEIHKSLATEITSERLHNLNYSSVRKINISINELTDKMNEIIGTKVSFEIPFRYVA